MFLTISLSTLAIGIGAWLLWRQIQKRQAAEEDAAARRQMQRSIAAMDYAQFQRRRTDRTDHDDLGTRRGTQWSPRRPPVPQGKSR